MGLVLLTIPVWAFLILWATFWGMSVRRGQADGRKAFLEASAVWGALLVVGSESLSLFRALDRGHVAAYWTLVAVGSAYGLVRARLLAPMVSRLREWRPQLTLLEWILLGVMVGVVTALLVVAWISPPNNVDSLLYHMSRVVHWAQNRGLQHYASGYVNQIVMPIWAETVILHLRVLFGNDHPANLVQWFALVGSLLAVSRIARTLGARRGGQAVAAAFVLAIPMVMLQATSTQNDLVVAYWLACLLFWVLEGRSRPWGSSETIYIGLVLGLGTLTKGTFYVYALPVMVWYLSSRLRSGGGLRVLAVALAVASITGAVNLGFWWRNLQTYGGILGNGDHLARYLTILRPDKGEEGQVQGPWLAEVLAGSGRAEAQMLGWDLKTPSVRLNAMIEEAFENTPALFGQEYASAYSRGLWNHEDTAGNLLPLAAVVLMLPVLAVLAARERGGLPAIYGGLILAGYALIPLVIDNGRSLNGVRFQVPVLVSWAPLAGVVASRGIGNRWISLAGLILALLGLPWLLFNNTRPLISRMPWTTRTPSVLTATPHELLFAMAQGSMDEYLEIAHSVDRLGCRDIGLRLDSHDFEYLFWAILGAPQSGLRLETLHTYPELERYLEPTFRPCAIICTICGGRSRVHGLESVQDFGKVQLYSGQGYTPDPDG